MKKKLIVVAFLAVLATSFQGCFTHRPARQTHERRGH